MKKIVIAIDGPAASGKSTTSKLVAERLGYLHIDTGAMYRAITLKVLEYGYHLSEEDKISQLVENTEIQLRREKGGLRVFLDKRDVTQAIRTQAVTNAASAVSSIKKVREVLVREQQHIGKKGGIVLEGRDIGTVVFPKADLKIFMVASIDERARRRKKELDESGTKISLDELVDEINQRDMKDSQRDLSPLRQADDAIELDTSNMTIDEQVNFIVDKAKEIIEN